MFCVTHLDDMSTDKLEVSWFIEQCPMLKISAADDSRKLEIEIT